MAMFSCRPTNWKERIQLVKMDLRFMCQFILKPPKSKVIMTHFYFIIPKRRKQD